MFNHLISTKSKFKTTIWFYYMILLCKFMIRFGIGKQGNPARQDYYLIFISHWRSRLFSIPFMSLNTKLFSNSTTKSTTWYIDTIYIYFCYAQLHYSCWLFDVYIFFKLENQFNLYTMWGYCSASLKQD